MSGTRGYLDGEPCTITGSFDDGEKRGYDVLMDDGKERWFCGAHRFSLQPPAPRSEADVLNSTALAFVNHVVRASRLPVRELAPEDSLPSVPPILVAAE